MESINGQTEELILANTKMTENTAMGYINGRMVAPTMATGTQVNSTAQANTQSQKTTTSATASGKTAKESNGSRPQKQNK